MDSIKCVFPSKKPLCHEALAQKIMRKVPTTDQSLNVSSDLCCIHARVPTSVSFHSQGSERLAEVCGIGQKFFLDLSNYCLLTSVVYPYLSQEIFDAVRRGPQDVGAGPEDIRGPSMYIATIYDFGCKTWTHDSPSHQVIDSFLYVHTDQLLFSFHCKLAHTENHVQFCDLQNFSLQVLKRLVAYARSSAALLVELIKGDKDDRQWLVWFLKH
jgi:hypothetical protein